MTADINLHTHPACLKNFRVLHFSRKIYSSTWEWQNVLWNRFYMYNVSCFNQVPESFKRPTNAFGSVNIILLHSNHRVIFAFWILTSFICSQLG